MCDNLCPIGFQLGSTLASGRTTLNNVKPCFDYIYSVGTVVQLQMWSVWNLWMLEETVPLVEDIHPFVPVIYIQGKQGVWCHHDVIMRYVQNVHTLEVKVQKHSPLELC